MNGFVSGFVSHMSPAAKWAKEAGNSGYTGPDIGVRILTAALFGGLASVATGGSFVDGAITAATVHLFNAEGENGNFAKTNGGFSPGANDLAVNWPSLPQGFVDASAGLGDAILFGFGDGLRGLVGVDGGINYGSSYYRYTGYAATASLGGARLGYAAAVKGYSVFAGSAAASSFRTSAGNFFRFGASRPYQPNLLKYITVAALRAAAGRTNSTVNALGATHVGANVYNIDFQLR